MGAERPAPRLLGRAYQSRGRWTFDPARRWRGGRRELTWSGTHPPEDGDYCIAEVPDDGPAFLVEVLGAEDRPEWDEHGVISQFRLRRQFPARAEQEAAAFREPGPKELHGRLDLRGRLTFTIDPADARDHDDALSLESGPHGRFEVGIHIADVSHYVTPGSALDDEARARGTSTYLPGGVVPMLPHALSSDLCSLRPERDRLALSVLVDLDRDGRIHGWRFAETVIRSRHRLSYEEVQAMLDGAVPATPVPAIGKGLPEASVERGLPAAPAAAGPDAAIPPLLETLRRLRDLARALRRRRFAAGALALEVPEIKARVDAHGVTEAIERRTHLESHELIEEFMLLANRCVGEEGARRAADTGAGGVMFRVHEPPVPRKLAELDAMLHALRLPRLGQLDDPARALQGLLAAPLDPAHRRLLHRLVLRSLARARYLDRDLGHFGLATREYCHFTSPIRRYPDLHNHARVREWIRGQRSGAWDPVELEALAAQCTATEQNATDAEREGVRVKALRFIEGRLGDAASGIITGLIPQGFFVELDAIPVEGFVRVALYFDEMFVLDSSGVRMVGRRTRRRFVLGDTVHVTIARVDVPARECDLALEVTPRTTRRRRQGRR